MLKKMILLVSLLMVLAVPAHAGFQDSVNSSQPYLYKFSSGTTITTIKSAPGVLHTLTVTGGTAATIDIYDGNPTVVSSAVLIYSFTSTNALTSYLFDIGFSSGCTIETNGSALKYTASYL